MQTGLLLFTICMTSEQFVFVRVIQLALYLPTEAINNLQVKLSVVHRSHFPPSVASIQRSHNPSSLRSFTSGLKHFFV